MERPAVTTRPIFWIARKYGVDYTTALNTAWGLKQAFMTPGATFIMDDHPELRDQIARDCGGDYGLCCGFMSDLARHIGEFCSQQGWTHG